MPDSLILVAGLTTPGVQISDQTDLNIVAARCYTERWSVDLRVVKTGMTIQVAANNKAGHQPRGWVINSVITQIDPLPPRPNEKRKRYRIHFLQAQVIDTGRRNITFMRTPIRYF